MKRILSLVLSIAVIMSCIMIVPAFAATGTGKQDDPIIIETEAEFADYFGTTNKNKGLYFKLDADLDLTKEGVNYTPTNAGFISFDGQGHTINVNITTGSYPSLFGRWYAYDTSKTYEIKDLTVTGTIGNDSTTSAGFVAVIEQSATFNLTNLTNRATVTGAKGAGGIIGINYSAPVINVTGCKNYGDIASPTNGYGGAGGIFGFIGDSKNVIPTVAITDCKNYGKISSTINAGGIAGRMGDGTEKKFSVAITNSANYGEIAINGTKVSGAFAGIIGYAVGTADSSTTVSKCYNAGKISGYHGNYTSGIVGRSDIKLTVEDCYNVGEISETSGTSFKGAMVGYNLPAGSIIKNCYTTGYFTTTGTRSQPMYTVSGDSVNVTSSGLYYLEGINTAATVANAEIKTAVELAKLDLGSNWELATNLAKDNSYPFPQIKDNDYKVNADTTIIENTTPACFATGKAEDVVSGTEQGDNFVVPTDYAVVYSKCKDIPYYTTTFGMLLSKTGDFTDAKDAIVEESETLKRNEDGGFGVLFYGTGLTEGTYYVKPYAKYTAPDGISSFIAYGKDVEFTME